MSDSPLEPPWLALARRELGVAERPGTANEPRVLAYYRDAGHPGVEHDSVAWCAAFASAMLERAVRISPRTLVARDFLSWGEQLTAPRPGCIVVLWRSDPQSWQGHVGFLLGETATTLILLSGNDGDAVAISSFPKSRLLGYRWPVAASDPNFEVSLAHVLEMEGGWSDDPADPGGITNKGITLDEFARWLGTPLTEHNRPDLIESLRRIDDDLLARIYRTSYWLASVCHCLPPAVALMHFDCAVNQGVHRAALFLQRALGVEVDGEIGPITLTAARNKPRAAVLASYADLRRAHYRSLSHFTRFGRGWLARVDMTLARASALKDPNPPSRKETPPMANNPQPGTAAPKWWGNSMTIWGIVITSLSTVVPVVAQLFGVDISAALIQELGDGLTGLAQALAGVIGTLITILGRIRATQPLALLPGSRRP